VADCYLGLRAGQTLIGNAVVTFLRRRRSDWLAVENHWSVWRN